MLIFEACNRLTIQLLEFLTIGFLPKWNRGCIKPPASLANQQPIYGRLINDLLWEIGAQIIRKTVASGKAERKFSVVNVPHFPSVL